MSRPAVRARLALFLSPIVIPRYVSRVRAAHGEFATPLKGCIEVPPPAPALPLVPPALAPPAPTPVAPPLPPPPKRCPRRLRGAHPWRPLRLSSHRRLRKPRQRSSRSCRHRGASGPARSGALSARARGWTWSTTRGVRGARRRKPHASDSGCQSPAKECGACRTVHARSRRS